MAVRERLDQRTALDRNYTAMRTFIYEGKEHEKGDPFDKTGLTPRQLQTLYVARYIEFSADDAAPEPDVTLTSVGGGNYDIAAPWLDKPLRVKGKDAAQAEAERMIAEGPPLGFIEGGSDVTVEDVGGGWYGVTAPWLDMPEKVHGRGLAEKRQREIHDAGEPATYKGVTVTPGENGWFEITSDWGGDPEKVQGAEKARARANELRTAGPPPEGQAEAFAAAVTISLDGENDKYVLNAPGLEAPETFDSAADATARRQELLDAGPPEGWEPVQPGGQ